MDLLSTVEHEFRFHPIVVRPVPRHPNRIEPVPWQLPIQGSLQGGGVSGCRECHLVRNERKDLARVCLNFGRRFALEDQLPVYLVVGFQYIDAMVEEIDPACHSIDDWYQSEIRDWKMHSQ